MVTLTEEQAGVADDDYSDGDNFGGDVDQDLFGKSSETGLILTDNLSDAQDMYFVHKRKYKLTVYNCSILGNLLEYVPPVRSTALRLILR